MDANVVSRLGKYLTFLQYGGRNDITGLDFEKALEYALEGQQLNKNVGLPDVVKGQIAWSAKTVKEVKSHDVHRVRIISGRNSPDYNYGIQDAHKDIQATGRAVINIWNERVKDALKEYNELRCIFLVRDYSLCKFTVWEHEATLFNPDDFEWKLNANGNLDGFYAGTDIKKFTWQFHGSQFSIYEDVPKNSIKFSLRKSAPLSCDEVCQQIGFNDNWINYNDNQLD